MGGRSSSSSSIGSSQPIVHFGDQSKSYHRRAVQTDNKNDCFQQIALGIGLTALFFSPLIIIIFK